MEEKLPSINLTTTAKNTQKYEVLLNRMFPYKDRIVDFVLI